ncbi:MAG TPA: His/Gly/Thr/Pro-type tRNA ligase C-terminal domain-containing protein [Humisphaera sp.]
MRWSQLLIPTQKDAPTDAGSKGHELLLRAGYVRQSGSGLYDLLPLAARVVRKVEAAARRAAESAGAAEVMPPSLQPAELWRLAGRAGEAADVRDAAGRQAKLAVDASPAVAALATAFVRSHKQLPLLMYRAGESFPAEPKPGGGLLRTRARHELELLALTAGGDGTPALRDVARRTLADLGLAAVEADDVGGASFLLPTPAGPDAVLSDAGGYAASPAVARTGFRSWGWGGDPGGELEKVHTPGVTTVDDVAKLLSVPTSRVLKALVFRSDATRPTLESGVNAKWVVAVVRGDHEVNVAKLQAAAREHFQVGLTPLEASDELAATFAVGFVGPDVATRKVDAVLVVDYDAANNADWVAGANEVDHHARHFHWFRECGDRLADPRKTAVADIRDARDGDPAPAGGNLKRLAGVTVATVGDLGTALAEALGARYTDAAGGERPVRLARLSVPFEWALAALAETCHDDRGLAFPPAVAPFGCVVTPVKYEGESRSAADHVVEELESAGVDVLLDDRDVRPGAKFAEADLIGVPVRVTIGERSLREGAAELKRRTDAAPRTVPLDQIAQEVREALLGG